MYQFVSCDIRSCQHVDGGDLVYLPLIFLDPRTKRVQVFLVEWNTFQTPRSTWRLFRADGNTNLSRYSCRLFDILTRFKSMRSWRFPHENGGIIFQELFVRPHRNSLFYFPLTIFIKSIKLTDIGGATILVPMEICFVSSILTECTYS